MIKVVQFGEGNFLRCFADAYFDTLCEEGYEYSVDIVTPIPANLDSFKEQDNKYSIILRGVEKGEATEKVKKIKVVNSVINPFENQDSYYALARQRELKIIVSNTTEAGIVFRDSDSFDDFSSMTFPAKLTRFLYERFKEKLDGVYLMPVELIDNNADRLKQCVDKYIELWKLPLEFFEYNNKENYYCNTLVDRIVSGYPRDNDTKERLTKLIGCEDKLMTVGEPFGLWAVEKKGDISKYIPEGKHNIEVVLTEDINYYKKRKVRILNGSHTGIVAMGLMQSKQTVFDCMQDEKIKAFMSSLLNEEIIPFVSDDREANEQFAQSVLERFANPYLNHQLISISLNSISKFKARNLCSFEDYYNKNDKIPTYLTVSLSYLMALYSGIKKEDNGYFVNIGDTKLEIKDDAPYLEYFSNGGSVEGFLKRIDVWGSDLSLYPELIEAVNKNVQKILGGEKIYE